jgi:CPA2 family monovalent cation:H+ antiporter-2
MDAPDHLPYLREALLFFVCAGILIPLLEKRRISPVLGFLVVGNLLGPFGLGSLVAEHPWLRHLVIADIEGVRPLAELGVTFLLFVIGLELSFQRLLDMRRLVFGAGTAQVVFSSLAIGVVAYAWGNPATASLVLGLCLALSSTAVVMQLLVERRELGTPLGRASFAVLLLQDLAVIPLLVLLSALGGSGGSIAALAGYAALKALIAIGLLVLVGRGVLRPLFRRVANLRQPGGFMALTLLVVIGTATLTAAAGLSAALGAFLAGLLLAETEYRHEIGVNIEPFRALLMGLFFLSVGMAIDLRVLLDDPFWVAASVAGLFLLKGVIVLALLRMFGLAWGASAEAGLLLGGGGEFAFIAVGVAMMVNVLDREVGQFMLIVVGLSMLATPMVAALAHRLRRYLDARLHKVDGGPAAEFPAQIEGHVVIAGFGRVGQLIGRTLDANAVPYVALDGDARLVERLRALRAPVHFGDASRAELLQRAGVERAAAVVVTLNDGDAARHCVDVVRRHFPQVPVLARAHDDAHARLLRAAGATGVVPETLEAGLQLSGHVLEAIGVPAETRDDFLDRQRERELARHAQEG